MSDVGVIYLLHFDNPLHHAGHYVGWTHSLESLASRLKYHENGNGSKLLAAHRANGGTWVISRLWQGTRNDERRVKNGHCTRFYCPECRLPPRPIDLKEIGVWRSSA